MGQWQWVYGLNRVNGSMGLMVGLIVLGSLGYFERNSARQNPPHLEIKKMAQRQRPKVANYSSNYTNRNEIRQTVPSVPLQTERERPAPSAPAPVIPKKANGSSIESKRVRHASSGKPISNQSNEVSADQGGKMTKFRSLDDIPDITEDFNPFDQDIEEEEEEEISEMPSQPQYYVSHPPKQMNSQPIRTTAPLQTQKEFNPPPLPAEINQRPFQPYQPSYVHESDEEIEEDYEIPPRVISKPRPPQPQTRIQTEDYEDDDDWNSDDGDGYSYASQGNGGKSKQLPPLPSTQRERQGERGRESNRDLHGKVPRHPSPIIYDPTAYAPNSQQKLSPNSQRSPEEKLYYERQPREVEYKPYTLKDYRKIKPQQYVELGKLQPDLQTEELIAKRANVERIKEFSKNLKDYNKNMIVKTLEEKGEGGANQKKEMESKKEKAEKYAQNIPKPKVKVERNDSKEKDNIGMREQSMEVNKLEELTSKHLQSKKQVEAIKRSLGL